MESNKYGVFANLRRNNKKWKNVRVFKTLRKIRNGNGVELIKIWK